MITRATLHHHLVKLWERQQYFLAPDMKGALERAGAAEQTDLAKLHFTINLDSLEQTSKARFATVRRHRHAAVLRDHRGAGDPRHRGRCGRPVRGVARSGAGGDSNRTLAGKRGGSAHPGQLPGKRLADPPHREPAAGARHRLPGDHRRGPGWRRRAHGTGGQDPVRARWRQGHQEVPHRLRGTHRQRKELQPSGGGGGARRKHGRCVQHGQGGCHPARSGHTAPESQRRGTGGRVGGHAEWPWAGALGHGRKEHGAGRAHRDSGDQHCDAARGRLHAVSGTQTDDDAGLRGRARGRGTCRTRGCGVTEP